jgi:pimeloyl-ACP methyl ester carboxylesterase
MATPLFFLPGLLEDADLFERQVEHFTPSRECLVADLTRADTIAGMARDALQAAPGERFALAGHSMGGYVALEILRQAPRRVERLALLNTHARPDTAESTENRRRLMALAGKDFPAVIQTLMPEAGHRGAPRRRSHHGHDLGDGARSRQGGIPAPADRDHRADRQPTAPRQDRLPDPGGGGSP